MSVETIVAAIAAFASANAASADKTVAKDAYDGLKSLIQKRFGAESKAAVAVQELESNPKSNGRKTTLAEELDSAGAASDPELTSAAQALLALIRSMPTGERYIQTAQGTGIAQASHGSTASVTYSTGPKAND